jgi:very-short-patch-repair endonuclease
LALSLINKEKAMKYSEIRFLSRKLRKNQTTAEKLLWEKLRYRQLEGFKFLRQHPILYDRKGNDLNFFIPDFYCPKAKLAIEIDGGIHNEKWEQDLWREEILNGMRIRVLRFRNEDLHDLDLVIEEIRIILKERG